MSLIYYECDILPIKVKPGSDKKLKRWKKKKTSEKKHQ